ncbi:DUF4139 domain-containing protein [Streptomyces sp. NBC_01465]|uniref:DUF4139 domain-containing protein n=1 Tax=Streptomyces sp. NBC_01465 TaxID=2903878 RepID=UPI002E363F65|nr:DUF4139 domain-containing protein [Streptomyces sp. NBC_01465]
MTDPAAQPWESKLTSVVVYARGAVCRRLARGVVPSDGRVRVSGLPRSLDRDSLRARVVDTPGVRVSEVRPAVEAEPVAPGTHHELYLEVERLHEAQRVAQVRRDRQAGRIEAVSALRPVPPPRKREDPHRRTPVDAWLDLAGFVDGRLTALHDGLAELDAELRRIEHELGLATDRLARASTDAPHTPVHTTVLAELTVDGAESDADGTAVEVELEYRVPGAVWVPAYRLTHRQGEGDAQLVLRATVAQRTGEDWSDVQLGLSTADLLRPTGVPKLRSLRIGRRQAVPEPSGWREPPAGLADLFTGYVAAGPRPAPAPVRKAVASVGYAEEPAGFGAPYSLAPPAPGAAADTAPQGYGGAAPLPPPSARPRTGGGARPAAPAPPGQASAPPPPPPLGPPQPSASELDYSDLVLSGPDEHGGRRGLLLPGSPTDAVASEYRRRAELPSSLPLPSHAVRPRESAGSFDHRYDASDPTDIPSDGTWHTVTVARLPMGLRTEYVCVPSVDETVYATLLVSNTTDQALLAGPVDITVDGEHLPTTALPTLAPGATGRVGLGPAEAVRAARRTELRESTAGLRNTTAVFDHRVHVELANRLARQVTVEVRERVPVTSEPDVRIEERGNWQHPVDGEDGPEHHVPGTRLWRVDVPAGGTTVLDGGYEIRIPAAKALTGGNRRS